LGRESMSCAKRYFPEFIVKPFPRVFVEKFTEFRAATSKSKQPTTNHKAKKLNGLQLAA